MIHSSSSFSTKNLMYKNNKLCMCLGGISPAVSGSTVVIGVHFNFRDQILTAVLPDLISLIENRPMWDYVLKY